MSYFKGEKEFFPGIGQIQFEGRESKNPLAFHYYDADKVVMGKTLKDHLRFAMVSQRQRFECHFAARHPQHRKTSDSVQRQWHKRMPNILLTQCHKLGHGIVIQ